MSTYPESRIGPLAGIQILDLSSVILGPYATMILGDFGADIIKVEHPEGDSSRFVNPGRSRGMSGTALNLHRNKRSIALNLKNPAGRHALLRLSRNADALIHNVRPLAMNRLGLDYDSVSAECPSIVYCACTGYGSDGPYAQRPAYDDLIQGVSGLAALMGQVHENPRYVPSAICDKIVGMAAVNALVAALLHRERSGEGQYVEVPMFETMISFNLAEHICDAVFDPPMEPVGYARVLSPDRRPYATLDGYLCMLAYTDRQWRAFFRIVGREELMDDTRFRELSGRTQNVDALYGIVAEEVAKRTTAEWLDHCDQAQIPATPVKNLSEARSDPHLQAVEFFKTREHPSEGKYFSVGIPANFARTPCEVIRDAPRLNENGADILRENGFAEAEIQVLLDSGAFSVETI